jgi:type II secretion system protein G
MKIKKGFTLIELLVVVIIIAILAAIAVPQYQVAVLKARFSTVMSNTKAIKDAAEMYYLTYGEYPTDNIIVLDFDIPGCTKQGAGLMTCPNTNTSYNYNGNISTGQRFDVMGYYPMYNSSYVDGISILSYVMVLDHAQKDQGKIFCVVGAINATLARKVCKSISKTKITESLYEL